MRDGRDKIVAACRSAEQGSAGGARCGVETVTEGPLCGSAGTRGVSARSSRSVRRETRRRHCAGRVAVLGVECAGRAGRGRWAMMHRRADIGCRSTARTLAIAAKRANGARMAPGSVSLGSWPHRACPPASRWSSLGEHRPQARSCCAGPRHSGPPGEHRRWRRHGVGRLDSTLVVAPEVPGCGRRFGSIRRTNGPGRGPRRGASSASGCRYLGRWRRRRAQRRHSVGTRSGLPLPVRSSAPARSHGCRRSGVGGLRLWQRRGRRGARGHPSGHRSVGSCHGNGADALGVTDDCGR